MAKILTHKARIEQLGARGWLTLDNQLFELDNKRIILAPRNLVTDNNTNPFGDNDLCDVRASHFHDLGCRYKQLIYVNLCAEQLKEAKVLKTHQGMQVCKDIPSEYLSVEPVSFNEINKIFKQILLACDTGKMLSNFMRFAVNFNIGWMFSGKKKLDLERIYRERV